MRISDWSSDVCSSDLPIEEFTYLQPARCNGTRSAERMPHLERYWSAADPDYCDGEGAESFRALLGRCEAALARLAAMPPASLRSEEHTSELQSLMRKSYADFCLKKKKPKTMKNNKTT